MGWGGERKQLNHINYTKTKDPIGIRLHQSNDQNGREQGRESLREREIKREERTELYDYI